MTQTHTDERTDTKVIVKEKINNDARENAARPIHAHIATAAPKHAPLHQPLQHHRQPHTNTPSRVIADEKSFDEEKEAAPDEQRISFKDLPLSPQLQQCVAKLGFATATNVQAQSLKHILAHKDMIIRAKTGSGKTLAFLLPIMEMLDRQSSEVQALIMAPTRELAQQIGKDLHKLDPHTKQVIVYGGVGMQPQVDKLHRWAQIVIGTPGRLLDHLSRGTMKLGKTKYVVLDEADRMLEMGFIEDVKEILKHTPHKKQTLLFSATVPDDIIRLAEDYMITPEKLMLDKDEITVNKIKQIFYGMDRSEKLDVLMKLLDKKGVEKVIIFCNTKRWADSLERILRKQRFGAAAIHADLSQMRRNRVIEDFKHGKVNILVATDVAARGLHISDVSHVVNYDVPKNPKDYIHRIGRTGRVGKEGESVTFVTAMDRPLIMGIEREIRTYIEVHNIGKKQPQHNAHVHPLAAMD